MPWEEVAAFIGGPTALLLLLQSAMQTAEQTPFTSPTTPEVKAIETVQIGAQSAGNTSNGMTIIGLFISLCIFLFCVYLAFNPSFLRRAKEKLATLGKLVGLRSGNQNAQPNGRESSTSGIYYETAIRLGAIIALADGHVDPRQLSILKRVFNLNEDTYPQTDNLYAKQLDEPLSMRAVITPFVTRYGRGSAVAETLIFGMSSVAMSDGKIAPSELMSIMGAAGMLGIGPAHTRRLLMHAGYFGEQEHTYNNQSSSSNSDGSSKTYHRTAGLDERGRHLQTLGLTRGASKAQIRKVWRKLASQYHPDKLVSQNLPPQELERANDMMQSINAAYDWLKNNPT